VRELIARLAEVNRALMALAERTQAENEALRRELRRVALAIVRPGGSG
jgi:hypothetical protein